MGKIIESFDVDDWEVWTDDGWKDIQQVHKTIKYDVWELKTKSHDLKCADKHIIMDKDYNEVYVQDLKKGDRIITESGVENVVSVKKLKRESEHMYDMSIDSKTHTYFTNGILSHNTTISTVYLLHYLLFNKDKNIAIIANKEKTALEIMQRVKMAYGLLPMWLQQGIKEGGWNKSSIRLENGMTAKAATTSSDSISGETISLLYMDEFAKVKPNIAEDFITATYPVVSSGKKSKIIMVSCVTDTTFVLTPNGIKEVSDFINYDIPDNPNFGYCVDKYSVMGKRTFNNGNLMVNSGFVNTKIIKSPSSYVECSLRHPWFVCKDGIYNWIRTKHIDGTEYIPIKYGLDVWGNNDDIRDIEIKDYAHNVNDYRITKITEDFAYFMGLYLSEGSVNKKGSMYVGITITCGDDISGVLNKLNYKFSCGDGLHYNISSKMLCDILMSLGFDLSKHAKEKIIPKRLFEMSKRNIIALIQGIMDGDGSSQINRGTVCIGLSSKRMIEQIRAILNNFGILSIYHEGITPPTKIVKVESKYYRIELNSTMSRKYYDIIGFRFNRKQLNETYLSELTRRDSYDIIPYSKDIITGLKISHNGDYKKIVESGIIKGNYKKNKHFSRAFMLKHKNFLLSLNNKIINDLYENISDDIKWELISDIKDSQNCVYDFSLNHDDDDIWCHSVLFNNIVGSNTPVGMNHFYEFWAGAIRGPEKDGNNFFPIKVGWWEHPNRDDAWKEEMVRDIGIVRFNQEFGCPGFESYINIRDKKTGKIEKIKIGDFYNRL